MNSSVFAMLAALVLGAHAAMTSYSFGPRAPARTVPLRMDPIDLPGASAWALTAPDKRFGGISALAFANGRLVALTDAGTVLRFAPGGRTVHLSNIDGPGPAGTKRGRDSEALVRDPAGYWVAFEQRHSLFRFDRDFRPLARFDLDGDWRDNKGVEAMVADGRGLLLFPESGRQVVEWSPSGQRTATLAGAGGPIADAVRLPNGQVWLLLRDVTPLGITNALGLLARGRRGYRVTRTIPLPLGRFANGEAITAEPRPNGAVRLWIMTDNDFRSSMPTLLVAIDLRDALEAKKQP